jgi:hypothetical protein
MHPRDFLCIWWIARNIQLSPTPRREKSKFKAGVAINEKH